MKENLRLDFPQYSAEHIQAAGDLSDYDLTIQKATTKNGNPVWELKGVKKDDTDMINVMKRFRARWYGPKKSWSFYQEEDPTPKILAEIEKVKPKANPIADGAKPAQETKQPEIKTPTPETTDKYMGFKENDRVKFTLKGKELTGTIKRLDDYSNISPNLGMVADVDVDQIEHAGGVPIGRREIVRLDTLSKLKEATKTPAESPAKTDTTPAKKGTDTVESSNKPQEVAVSNKPESQIANIVMEQITNGESININDLTKQANEVFGGTQAEGKYSIKDLYDSIELGVNKYLSTQKDIDFSSSDINTVKENADKIEKIVDGLPTQTKRTDEMVTFQQFSTPPHIAYVASWLSNTTQNDTVLEPSAGIGGLVVFAKNIGAEVVVNELSERRLEVLKQLNLGKTFNENAEQINNILPIDIKPTRVIMNPPFSSTSGRIQGKTSTKNAIPHIEQALKRLEPGGRLVAIVGNGMADNSPSFNKWWGELKKEYNIRANVGLDGKNYRKYGTSFDIQIVVIDKTGPTTTPTITGQYSNLSDMINDMEAIQGDINQTDARQTKKPEQASNKPTLQEDVREGEVPSVGGNESIPSTDDRVGAGRPVSDDSRVGVESDIRSEESSEGDTGATIPDRSSKSDESDTTRQTPGGESDRSGAATTDKKAQKRQPSISNTYIDTVNGLRIAKKSNKASKTTDF